MAEVTIYFDESGNTGPDLLNRDQPVFVLSSVGITRQTAARLLRRHFATGAKEFHFARLAKYRKNHSGFAALLSDPAISRESANLYFVNKRFMITCKCVDLLIEPRFFGQGFDYYDSGMALVHANMLYLCISGFCGQENADSFYSSFVKMYRNRTDESIVEYKATVDDLRASCSDRRFLSELRQLSPSRKYLVKELSATPSNVLEPAIPSFVELAFAWNRQLGRAFNIVHDDSSPIERDKVNLQMFMDLNEAETVLGYGTRKFSFPLRVAAFSLESSAAHSELQLADVLAGCHGKWLSGVYDLNKRDELWNVLDGPIRTKKLFVDGISPSSKVDLYEDRIRRPGDINPVDFLTLRMIRKKDPHNKSLKPTP